MKTTADAILRAIDKSGTASYTGIYAQVITMCGPVAHEGVKSELARLEAEGTIRRLRLGGSPEWTRVR